jgi:hypothetical protein
MRQLRLVLPVLAILWCPFVATAQVDFSSTDAFLKSTLKGEDRLEIQTKGDLNGDGREDWAGVIERKKLDSERTHQLYVLLQLVQGGYNVADKSKEEEIPGTGCCWIEGLEIRNSSIYIQNNSKAVGESMEAVTYQFKLYKGEWRLVGAKVYYTDFRADPPNTIDTDMNLLTGSVMEKRQKGDEKPLTKTRRKRFRVYLLKDFDFVKRI